MKSRVIDQFLFPYQHSFRGSVEVGARSLFELIGADAEPSAFLVGVAWPAIAGRHGVCVEPETGPWPQSLFSMTSETLEAAWSRHPNQQMFYGDEQTMRGKPEISADLSSPRPSERIWTANTDLREYKPL